MTSRGPAAAPSARKRATVCGGRGSLPLRVTSVSPSALPSSRPGETFIAGLPMKPPTNMLAGLL